MDWDMCCHVLWTLDFGVRCFKFSRLRVHPEGPEALSARCATVRAEVIAEVPFATLTMQAVHLNEIRRAEACVD